VNLALACDVRIAGPRARFGITFSRLGLHPLGDTVELESWAQAASAQAGDPSRFGKS
jgi:enoyl-CoA hydratase/carnithine racemase